MILIGVLILVNGFFVAMEMALVTARRTRLEIKVKGGDSRATQVLAFQDQPGDFLATVQIGITLVGTAASAIGGAGIVQILSPFIARVQGLAPYSDSLALALVIIAIAYLTLVFGELVPKRLALRNAEGIAMAFTSPLRILSRLTHLPMRTLSFSTDAVLKLIGSTATQPPSTSPEEIEMLVKQGAAEGVILPVEEELIRGIFDYTDRRVQDVMTPRTAIIALDVDASYTEVRGIMKQSGYSRFPVFNNDLDHIVGYVHMKDIIWADQDSDLRQAAREVCFIPSGASLPEAFDRFTKTGTQIAIVLDEFGGTRGLLTLEDILEEIVGEIEDEHSPVVQLHTQKSEREWIIVGHSLVPEVAELLNIEYQPTGEYKTIAGFMMTELGRIPSEGDQLSKFGYLFTVHKMDHLRIVEVNVSRNH